MRGCGPWALLSRKRAKGKAKEATLFHFLGDEDSQSTSASTPLSRRSSKLSQISNGSTESAAPFVHFDLSANVVAERAWVDKVAANNRRPSITRLAGEELPAEELSTEERIGLAVTIRQGTDWLTCLGMPAYGKHLAQWLCSRLHDCTCIIDLEEGDAEAVRKWMSVGLRLVASGGAVDLAALMQAATPILEFRTDAGRLQALEELRAVVRAMRD